MNYKYEEAPVLKSTLLVEGSGAVELDEVKVMRTEVSVEVSQKIVGWWNRLVQVHRYGLRRGRGACT